MASSSTLSTFFFSEKGFFCINLEIIITRQSRLASEPQKLSCFCIPSAGITSAYLLFLRKSQLLNTGLFCTYKIYWFDPCRPGSRTGYESCTIHEYISGQTLSSLTCWLFFNPRFHNIDLSHWTMKVSHTMSFFGPSVSKVLVLGISLEYRSLVIHSGHSHFSGRNSSYLTNNINSKFDIFPSVLPRCMGILCVLIKPLMVNLCVYPCKSFSRSTYEERL